ncbi:MAG TPA: hypothetical protein VN461_13115 [Vicinamibacteria bacterium]|jgi:hypothetical protein|nr:hypothetical protein [Vicinamibacteria bacterium]
MSEARVTNPLVEQFRRGGVPKELRLLAAQGALPLKPEDVLELLTDLLHDAEKEIRDTAGASLAAFPREEFLPILKSRETPPAILAWGVTYRSERELREAALQNTSLTDEAVEALASSLSQELAELVVINQVRLLRRTSLLEALEANPSLNNDQRRRLRELRETFRIGQQPAEAPPPPAAPVPEPHPTPAVPEPVVAEAPISPDEAVVRILSDEERKDIEKVSAVQKIYRLNTAEKVITALKGTREDRAILVRDPNRIVSTAVLGSPRLTESEVEAFSGMKNISDEILRQIGSHREWTKKYSVVANLVRNPRTPLAISLGMVTRLNPRDIKSLAFDRNVPDAIRKHAQRFIKNAEQPGGKH